MGQTVYEIRIESHLAPRRFREFEDLTVTQEPDGETVLVGVFPDQSALHGLLNWLHNLGATLVALRRLEGTGE
jgi:hypothetical protein